MYLRTWFIVLCLFLVSSFLVGCGGGKGADVAQPAVAVQPQVELNQTWTLMIAPFRVTGKSKLSGEDFMDMLIAEMIDLEGYRIVDRSAMQETLNQVGLGMTDLADESSRAEVGKLLGAQLMCVGAFAKDGNRLTVRVNYSETGETKLAAKNSDKNNARNVEALAQKLKDALRSPKFTAFLNEQSGEAEEEVSPPVMVKVKGYGAIIDGDRIMAKELALKDAYANAIAQGCGIKLVRETQVENYQLVRDEILTESVGYVTSYEIVDENPDSELGYEVTVDASVSQQPISDLDKLQLMVKYLLAEPRIAILVEGELGGEELTKARATVISGQIAKRLQEAGFTVIDAQAVEEKKKEIAETLSKEDAARLASMLDANVTVRASLVSEIKANVEKIDGEELNFANVSVRMTGVVKLIRSETADVISIFGHEDLPPDSIKGYGTTEEAAVGEAIDKLAGAAANKLAWELSAKLGEPIRLRLVLDKVTMEQAEKFEQQLKEIPRHLIVKSQMLLHDDNKADYEVMSAVSSKVLQKKLLSLIDPAALDVEELVADKIEVGTISISVKGQSE